MKEVLSILAVTAIALVIIGVAVFAGGDRALFIPPPEMVVEDFTRTVTTRRFDLATRFLSTERQQSETPATVAGRFEPLFEAVGKVNTVETEPRWSAPNRASATATVDGDAGSLSFDFSLVFEDGLWKIDELPTLRPPDS